MAEYEYKAKSHGDGGGGHQAKKLRVSHRSTFNGVVTLTAKEYARAQECLKSSSGEPTEASKRGAALLKKLYG